MTGDINLIDVGERDTPFARVGGLSGSADFVASNLGCMSYIPPLGHTLEHEGDRQ